MSTPLDVLDAEIQYYRLEPIDKLSDFDKGVLKGREDGLIRAKNLIIEWAFKNRLARGEKE